MNLFQQIFGIKSYILLRKNLCCRFGYHGPDKGPTGQPANFCCWGCGKAFNPNAFQDYVVTLKDGTEYVVSAVNDFHAGSVVVYGPGATIDPQGKTREPVRVHRENIASVCLKNPISPP